MHVFKIERLFQFGKKKIILGQKQQETFKIQTFYFRNFNS